MPQRENHSPHHMSIKPPANPLFLFVGALFGTALLLSAYVAQVNAAIDLNNPETWPHMGPERFFFFIPVFALFLSAFAALVELVILPRFGHQLRARNSSCWFWVGAAYSLLLLGYNLSFVLGPGQHVLLVSLLATSLAVLLAHRFLPGPRVAA